jgi:hypothetical protein
VFVEASLLYLASSSSWFRRTWPLTAGLLAAAYAWGLALGFVLPAGIAAIAAVFLLALLCSRAPDGASGVALHGAFFALAVMLSAHWVPGFRNPLLLGPVAFTPDAYPFTMHLNLDKSAVGFALLLLYKPLCRRRASPARCWPASPARLWRSPCSCPPRWGCTPSGGRRSSPTGWRCGR